MIKKLSFFFLHFILILNIAISAIALFDLPVQAAAPENSPVISVQLQEKIPGMPTNYIAATDATRFISVYIGAIYKFAAILIGTLAVLMIVIGGIQVTFSGVSEGGVGAGKTRITQALSALVLLFISALILYTINPNFFNW